jgi:hypothetical protein
MDQFLLDAPSAEPLAARLSAWRADVEGWRRRIAPQGAALRAYSLDDMCAALVAAGETRAPAETVRA